MKDHHGPAKETDITAVLVVALVLMVGVLIAKTAGDFATKSTSTYTRAADADEKCKSNKPLKDGYYNSSSDWCEVRMDGKKVIEKKCSANSAYADFTKGAIVCGVISKCCRSATSIKALGDKRCEREVGLQSICATDCKSKGLEATKTLCALGNTNNFLNNAYCCKPPTPTPTPKQTTNPTPTPVTLDASSCGKDKIDCNRTFNYTAINGKNLQCIGNSAKSWCAYEGVKDQLCPGVNFAYPILKTENGSGVKVQGGNCLKEVIETATHVTQYKEGYFCSFAQIQVGINDDGTEADEGQRIENCKIRTAPTGHPND